MILHPRLILALSLCITTRGVVSSLVVDTARSDSLLSTNQTSIPQNDNNSTARAQAIEVKRQGYLYGPSLIGNASFFPTGDLADVMIQTALGVFDTDETFVQSEISNDLVLALDAVTVNGGLNTLDDYAGVLYDGQWKTSIPDGETPGILTNYTQDLLFSMERLSLNPYKLERLKPSDSAPFVVADSTVENLTVTFTTFDLLLDSGNLFVVDHSYQAKYPKVDGRYGAACTALFFIHPVSQDFLPLAIKTNVGSDLIYTPLDQANDWLLAKIMFNLNDIFHAQMFHLAASHNVGEIVHQAALRTLSDSHPIMALTDRLMYQAYAARPTGEQILFNAGGFFDQFFHTNSTGAINSVADFYPTAGAFQANYLEADLQSRGLLDSSFGLPLKNFPFYEDASKIRDVILTFMTSFINAYYDNDSAVANDNEIQAWLEEANGAAQVIDFPKSANKTTLIQVLTHFAYLNGVAHHTLNTGNPVASLATLPFHPVALYSPLPTAKGNVTNIVPFLPQVSAALGQVDLFAAFGRPMLPATNRTLAYAYSDVTFLSVFNSQVGTAASQYLAAMKNISLQVRARTFDGNGLCQGMPFVWKGLDPGTIPFYFAV